MNVLKQMTKWSIILNFEFVLNDKIDVNSRKKERLTFSIPKKGILITVGIVLEC